MKKIILAAFAVALLLIPKFSNAGNGILTLERIFKSEEFKEETFRPIKWQEDKECYTILEKSNTITGGEDIVQYDPSNNKRTVLVSADKLVPKGGFKALKIKDYSWSPDGSKLLIFTNSRKVWRDHTRGDYWVLNRNTAVLKKLGGNAQEATLMFAKFSPDGKKVAYVREHNIYTEDIETSEISAITDDGTETLINGTFDWVYEEEFGLQDGFRWSPDSKKIAFWQLDASGIGNFLMINNTDSLYSYTIPVQYPKAGTKNSSCRVGVVNVETGSKVWMNTPGDKRNNYIAYMEWAANSSELVVQHLNRLQNKLQVMLCNVESGKVKTVITEEDRAWVEVVKDMQWLDNGERFLWVSEKGGWRQVYLVSRNNGDMLNITPGDYDVIEILRIDEKKKQVFFIASPNNAAERYLFKISMKGDSKPQLITPIVNKAWHSYDISHDAEFAFHTYSTIENPPVTELIELPSHKVLKTVVSNKKVKENLKVLRKKPVRFFQVTTKDDIILDGYMMLPHDFDSTKKYPVLFYVYGEPAGQTVKHKWRADRFMWHTMLTQRGYIVMSVDNRGTPAPRGRDWRKVIYGKVGIVASQDQAGALEQISKWDFVDADRIGIWGWSGGGSMTLNMLFRYPGMYHTGMSVAPVAHMKYYDTAYQERYMGLPQENKKGYEQGSPLTHAHRLEGNLLLVHGTGDDNVHYQNAEKLINKLVKHGKYFSMMSYPNRSHSINEGEHTTMHLYQLLTRYLEENLESGSK
ncbi:MAG: S9 family peptidase [Bacteroidales bacterium]|nr:S9 family peptidase [Bacteroidales bacterium]